MKLDIFALNQGSARLTLDLSSHILAYHTGTDLELKNTDKQLRAILKESHFIFPSLVADAGATQEVIRSPAYFFLNAEFKEVFQNAIDGKLNAHQKQPVVGEFVLELDVCIQECVDDVIKIIISDNGTGFDGDILLLIANKELRVATDYYHTIRNVKSEDSIGRRLLLGGAGMGVRRMVGYFDYGNPNHGSLGISERIDRSDAAADLMDDRAGRHNYVVPNISELNFYNRQVGGTGAIIEACSSKSPLVVKTFNVTSAPLLRSMARVDKTPSELKVSSVAETLFGKGKGAKYSIPPSEEDCDNKRPKTAGMV